MIISTKKRLSNDTIISFLSVEMALIIPSFWIFFEAEL